MRTLLWRIVFNYGSDEIREWMRRNRRTIFSWSNICVILLLTVFIKHFHSIMFPVSARATKPSWLQTPIEFSDLYSPHGFWSFSSLLRVFPITHEFTGFYEFTTFFINLQCCDQSYWCDHCRTDNSRILINPSFLTFPIVI